MLRHQWSTVSTNVLATTAVLVGTVGAEALERAKMDVQTTIHEHAGRITQEQLDTMFARIEGEMERSSMTTPMIFTALFILI